MVSWNFVVSMTKMQTRRIKKAMEVADEEYERIRKASQKTIRHQT